MYLDALDRPCVEVLVAQAVCIRGEPFGERAHNVAPLLAGR
jgi:hypothetical protein